MLMSGDRSPINVSAIRAQLERKLLLNSRPTVLQSRDRFENDESREDSPVVPKHRTSGTILQTDARTGEHLVPPDTRMRTSSREPSKKPPLYPKPKLPDSKSVNIMADDVSSSNGHCPPVITVSSEENQDKELPPCLTESVLRRAQMFEENGSVPLSPSCSTANDSARPDSTVSTFSNSSCHKDFSDSDSDEDRRPEHLGINLDLEHLSPHKTGGRRTSSFGQSHDSAIHEKIMSELKRQGVVRSSSHQPLFKKRTETHAHRTKVLKPDNSVTSPDGIPSDIGKLRNDLKKKDEVEEAEFPSSNSDESHSRGGSMISDRNSTLTTLSDHDGVLEYNTGDPNEDNRLKKLHYAANEFYSMQLSFVKYLRDVGEIYPKYVQEYGNRIGKDLLSPPPGLSVHPVTQLSQELFQILNVHRVLLAEFTTLHSNWTSLNPNLSDVILRLSDFLKICRQFLVEKSRFIQEISKLLDENKDFEAATIQFEQKIFLRGVGAIVQQLDQVHQNFMRYKLLMQTYRRHLLEDTEEWKKAGEAIEKLDNITRTVNEYMGYATNEELYRLYVRFQYKFDVFYPGRRLIRQGEVMKQTRKELQPRYLILFSDILWICRVSSVIIGLGDFDMTKSYNIAIDGVRLDIRDHEDLENLLTVRSKQKSFGLIFSSVKERDQWYSDILNVQKDVKNFKRRMSEAIERQRRQSTAPIPILSPKEGLANETKLPTSASESSLCLSRSQSIDTSSQPSTPVAEFPHSDAPEFPTVKKRVKCSEVDKPVWLPDDSSTKCLMEGCDTSFSLLSRRHHCRDCGWLICSKCCGRAPLSKYEFKKEMVCPECYDKITAKYVDGTLFPARMVTRTVDGTVRIKLKKNNDLIEPQSLFVPPANKGLKKLNIDKRFKGEEGDVFSKVFVRSSKKGTEVLRYALLRDGCTLEFYKASLDEKPCESIVIYGFTLNEESLDTGGKVFELVHRNQIQTERRENVISFRVEHQKSIEKWSSALRKALEPA
ncbi:unnamed protein product [Auanema sp. JU1783]|nr:unnamed protein product [Auanema sp. JU1783]